MFRITKKKNTGVFIKMIRIRQAANGWAVPIHYCGLLEFIFNGAVTSSTIRMCACGVQQGNMCPRT